MSEDGWLAHVTLFFSYKLLIRFFKHVHYAVKARLDKDIFLSQSKLRIG